jgi:hypothetical protein
MTKEQSEALETLVDMHGLVNVAAELAQICSEKAAHIACNWQDDATARMWMNCSRVFDGVCDGAAKYFPPQPVSCAQ